MLGLFWFYKGDIERLDGLALKRSGLHPADPSECAQNAAHLVRDLWRTYLEASGPTTPVILRERSEPKDLPVGLQRQTATAVQHRDPSTAVGMTGSVGMVGSVGVAGPVEMAGYVRDGRFGMVGSGW